MTRMTLEELRIQSETDFVWENYMALSFWKGQNWKTGGIGQNGF